MKKTGIIILGMHRSGTSALTKVINSLGADLPTKLMPPVKNNNELGFFEPKDISGIHDEILASVGSAWDDVTRFPSDWYKTDEAVIFENKIVDILERDFKNSNLFVLKDPRMCRIVPFWKNILQKFNVKPKYILAVRNPLEVAGSLAARDNFSIQKSVLLWLNHFIESERETRGLDRSFLMYSSLINDWKSVTEYVSRDLDLVWPTNPNLIESEVHQFLSSKYRHHDSSLEDLLADQKLLCWVKDAYKWVVGKVNNKETSFGVLDKIYSEMTMAEVSYGLLYRQTEESLKKAINDELVREKEFMKLNEENKKYREEIVQLKKTNSELSKNNQNYNEVISEYNKEVTTNQSKLVKSNEVIQNKQQKLNDTIKSIRVYQHSHFNVRASNFIVNILKIVQKKYNHNKVKKAIEFSGIFDKDWYLNQNIDVENSGIEPLSHYIKYGAKEGRKPNVLFDSSWYFMGNTDVLLSGMNPLYHYIVHGAAERREPYPFFDYVKYENALPGISSLAEDLEVYRNNHIDNAPTVLLCAHIVGKDLFGGERSFLDMLEGARENGYNVVVAVPSPKNQEYIGYIRKYAQRIVVLSYEWWTKNKVVDDEVIECFARVIKENKIDVVHVNTIMLREPLIAARRMSIPSIVHVRELITYDPTLCEYIGESPDKIVEQVKESADFIFANSFAAANCFSKKHSTFIVPNTIDANSFDIENTLQSDTIRVAMISSNLPKKGVFDFVEVARQMQHLKNVRFLLIGPEQECINTLRLEQENGEVPTNIVFAGYYDKPLDALAQANIVLNLSNFQESFGRTVAEAMASRRPVVAYDWGALPELIRNGESGYLVPFQNIQLVVDRLKILCSSPEKIIKMGENGRQIILDKFDKGAYLRRVTLAYKMILDKSLNQNSFTTLSDNDKPVNLDENTIKVSVIVPNYNYSRYLKERLDSIINQTYKPIEIIFLDDASSDDSVAVAESLLSGTQIESVVIKNKTNKGVFKQWLAGIEKAKGNYVWIAEADDIASADFLQELVFRIWQEKSVIAYCQSRVIDENGDLIRAANYHHTDDLSTSRWKEDYSEIGLREVVDYFAYRNTIPNASACLINKEALLKNISVVDGYKYCGDWILYCALLRHGNVSYSSKTMNSFRRHKQSVTRSKNSNTDYLKELLNIRVYISNQFPICTKQIKRMNEFLDRDYQFDGIAKNSTSEIANKAFDSVMSSAKERGRFVFVTTNNGSFNGGSEVLWMETAIKLRELGHDVVVVIKRWYPFPEFFKEFADRGIKIFFKESLVFKNIVDFQPDLMVVSTGCQDEGVDWYEQCKEYAIPYAIINQLTKEEHLWPIDIHKNARVKDGYSSAEKVFFTCQNNHKIMESRLKSKISNYDIHFNSFHMDRNISLPFPDLETGIRIAVPARLLTIHKGQDVIIKLLSRKKWKDREVQVNFYGDGPDKEQLISLAKEFNVSNVCFIDRVNDVSKIWEENHIILLASKMEGLPIVLVGAMMCARMPVVTDVGGHAELVDDNINGFVAHGTSVDALDDAMERAYERKDEIEKLGKLARDKVLDYMPLDPVQEFSDKIIQIAMHVANSRDA